MSSRQAAYEKGVINGSSNRPHTKLYAKLSDYPSYYIVKAYCKAHNILARAYYHKDYVEVYLISPKSLLEDI